MEDGLLVLDGSSEMGEDDGGKSVVGTHFVIGICNNINSFFFPNFH